MNPKKQKVKDRRRASKLADQAWEAVNADNLDLAEKIIRRAVAAQVENPVLWNDQGVILGLRLKETEAAECYRAALSLAPTFAEPYANLAALRIRQGFTKEAVGLQTQAVRYAPQNQGYVERLEAYQALAGQKEVQTVLPLSSEEKPTGRHIESAIDTPTSDWTEQLAELDWHALGNRLTRDGCVLIAGLLDDPTCDRLRNMFDDEARFAKTVVMDQPDFGQGTYRYFRDPIPEIVDRLRREMYKYVAHIANNWQRLLGEPEHFPEEWSAFRDECHVAGQTTPTPILLKYGPGGFNALHRDLRGSVYFPIQMAVILSPRADSLDPESLGFQGGEFLLCDVPVGKKSLRREIAAGLGDVVLFCTRDRLIQVGSIYGLQPVKHGMAQITSGERFALGVPFHEYR